MNIGYNVNRREQKFAFLMVWVIITIVTTGITIFPFIADKQTVLAHAPTCISKANFNTECCFCGMSRAFIDITHGQFSDAYFLNKGSIWIFAIFLLNSFTFIIYSIIHINKKCGSIYQLLT